MENHRGEAQGQIANTPLGQDGGGEVINAGTTAAMDTGDWRNQLSTDARRRIVLKIFGTLTSLLPMSDEEGWEELKKITLRFEKKIYTAATSQTDYLRKISVKMSTLEAPPGGNNAQNPYDQGEPDSGEVVN